MEQRQSGNMQKLLMLSLLSAAAWAGAAGYEMRSYVALGGKTQEAFAWCEARNSINALTLPQNGKATFYDVNKGRPEKGMGGLGPVGAFSARLGQADAGAGQLYYPFSWSTGKLDRNGFIHISNVENVQDPTYRMTHINSFKLGYLDNQCRYVKDAAFMGVTNKRTVIIWDNGKTATYATRNFDGMPGVYVTGGRKRNTVEGGTGYQFNTADGYIYNVMIDEYRPASGAILSVYKGKQLKRTEAFGAYSVSYPLIDK